MPQVNSGYSIEQIYPFFLKICGLTRQDIDKKLFKRIVTEFNKRLSQTILEGTVIELPVGMGKLRIKKSKFNPNYLRYDYGEYNKTGKKLYHLNEHSDGFRAKWHWIKERMNISGQTAYSFVPVWTNKRNLSKEMKIKNGHRKYME